MKAKEAQDAQIVFGDPLLRIADEAHAARGDIGETADIIVNRAVGRADSALMVKSRRSASACQSRPNATLRLAAEGLDVLAQRRHLERLADR